MRGSSCRLALTAVFAALSALASLAYAAGDSRFHHNGFEDGDRHGYYDWHAKDDGSIQLGPRPYYLVKGMDDSDLKKRLLRCQNGPFRRSDFSIGHRGAALQCPEHTKESYEAAARMGAGTVECDVIFTKDKELVCRHSECDLHTTTDIVTIPELNQKCSVPYSGPGSSPKCCAVYLDDIDPTVSPPIPRLTIAELEQLKAQGVKIIAPPLFALLEVNSADEIVPSPYALDIKGLGFDIITWTFERSDLRRGAATAGFYYLFDMQGKAIQKDSDMYEALDVLARQVGILGIFSDWPATVTYYANCLGLE